MRATEENWCWNIFCSTCRHAYFRCGFLELADGKHPNDEAWLSGQKHHHEMFGQLFDRSERALNDPKVLRGVVTVLADASIQQIATICKFPDWLGYLGLGLFHTKMVERNDRKLTNRWIPQLTVLLPEDDLVRRNLQKILNDPKAILQWQDLGTLEPGLCRPPSK